MLIMPAIFLSFTFSDRVRIEILHTPNHLKKLFQKIFLVCQFFLNKQKLSYRPATTPGVKKNIIIKFNSTSSMFVYVRYYILLCPSPLNYHIYLDFLALLINKPNSFICDFTKSKVVYWYIIQKPSIKFIHHGAPGK